MGVYFTVEHRCNLLSALLLDYAERVASRHRLRQSQVEPLEKLRCRLPPPIELGKHEGMKRVVDRRRDFRRNDTMSFSVVEHDAGRFIALMKVLGHAELLRASP